MKSRTNLLFALFASLVAASCLANAQSPAPLCVSGFQAGQSLKMTLGSSYDAKSQYVYDASLVTPPDPRLPSCDGADGLSPGSPVSFALVDPMERSNTSDACVPWFSHFQPEGVASPHLVLEPVEPVAGVTIAASFAKGTIAGRAAYAMRELFTPGKDPNAVAAPVQLPPLVVSRSITWDDDPSKSCYDAWVASW